MSAIINKYKKVIDLLIKSELTVATAESCTGGWIGKTITDISGSSKVFRGGIIAYSNDVKIRLLGVPDAILSRYGAVSEETAVAMASGCLEKIDSDFSIAVTGIAGPGGGTSEKPVGTVHICVMNRNGLMKHRLFLLNGSRNKIRKQTVDNSMKMLVDLISEN